MKHHHEEWISIETPDKIRERKDTKTANNNNRTTTEKVNAHVEYLELNKRVERSIRADKRKFVEDHAMSAEEATRKGNMQQLDDTTRNW
ncbi:unnamed protein product [Schistosoma mattheei]|uniref:Uncharacterized protein n=1 Tax=Schistosoma mattheei TaxID=31246 RepID=A0A183PC22_9TREM|nr:unnamed protein product [Schistosoma mattheei]